MVEDVLTIEIGVGGGVFFSSADAPGGLIDATVGAELGASAGSVRPWVSVHFGVGVTGDLARPILRIAVGLDVAASEEITLGPTIAYGHLFQEDGEGFTDDAIFPSLGVTMTWRSAPTAPAPAPAATPPPAARRITPPPPLPPPEPTEELLSMIDDAAGLRPRELLVPVLFEFDSTELVTCSIPALHALRDHLEERPDIRVLEIEGHADGSGSDAYNDTLSLARAEAIRDWLVARGVAPERLRVAARGERAPVEDEAEAEGRAQNRRVRFLVVSEGE